MKSYSIMDYLRSLAPSSRSPASSGKSSSETGTSLGRGSLTESSWPADTFEWGAPAVDEKRVIEQKTNLLYRVFHPAASFFHPERIESVRKDLAKTNQHATQMDSLSPKKTWINSHIKSYIQWDERVNDGVARGEASRLTINSTGGTQLEGILVHASLETRHPWINKPMMVMVAPNGETGQHLLDKAEWHAQHFDCDVLLYNSRGIGKSTGPVAKGMNDAVKDCQAAIRTACALSNNVAVWGHSLGGALAAEALHHLQQEPEIASKINLYINHKSFTSLSRAAGSVVQGALPQYLPIAQPIRSLSRALFKLSAQTNLNTAKILENTKLARKTFVFSSQQDEILQGDAQLGQRLSKLSRDDVILEEGYQHHMHTNELLENEKYQYELIEWVNLTI